MRPRVGADYAGQADEMSAREPIPTSASRSALLLPRWVPVASPPVKTAPYDHSGYWSQRAED